MTPPTLKSQNLGLGGAHKVDLLRKPANSYQTAKPQIYAHSHIHTHTLKPTPTYTHTHPHTNPHAYPHTHTRPQPPTHTVLGPLCFKDLNCKQIVFFWLIAN